MHKNRRAHIPERAFLEVLGAESLSIAEEKAVSEILNRLASKAVSSPPVPLSSVAVDFLVEPDPLITGIRGDGRIEYDEHRGRFLIKLPEGSLREPDANERRLFATYPDLRLTPRARFTYAHELAHRFFFVRSTTGWRRALELALDRLPSKSRLRAQRVLLSQEESACNRIAARVLTPDDLLIPKIHETLGSFGHVKQVLPDFQRLVEKVARDFAVSKDCIMVAIQRAIKAGLVSFPDDACLFLIQESNKTGHSSKSRWGLRVKISVLPSLLREIPLKPIFTGLNLENLGPQITRFAWSAVNDPSAIARKDISLPLTLRRLNIDQGSGNLPATFEGNWAIFGSTRYTRELLLWGRIKSTES